MKAIGRDTAPENKHFGNPNVSAGIGVQYLYMMGGWGVWGGGGGGGGGGGIIFKPRHLVSDRCWESTLLYGENNGNSPKCVILLTWEVLSP